MKLVVEQYRGQINPVKFFEDSKKNGLGQGLRSGLRFAFYEQTLRKKTVIGDFGIFFKKLGLRQDRG